MSENSSNPQNNNPNNNMFAIIAVIFTFGAILVISLSLTPKSSLSSSISNVSFSSFKSSLYNSKQSSSFSSQNLVSSSSISFQKSSEISIDPELLKKAEKDKLEYFRLMDELKSGVEIKITKQTATIINNLNEDIIVADLNTYAKSELYKYTLSEGESNFGIGKKDYYKVNYADFFNDKMEYLNTNFKNDGLSFKLATQTFMNSVDQLDLCKNPTKPENKNLLKEYDILCNIYVMR